VQPNGIRMKSARAKPSSLILLPEAESFVPSFFRTNSKRPLSLLPSRKSFHVKAEADFPGVVD
jgi:hypothetical protein